MLQEYTVQSRTSATISLVALLVDSKYRVDQFVGQGRLDCICHTVRTVARVRCRSRTTEEAAQYCFCFLTFTSSPIGSQQPQEVSSLPGRSPHGPTVKHYTSREKVLCASLLTPSNFQRVDCSFALPLSLTLNEVGSTYHACSRASLALGPVARQAETQVGE